MYFQRRRVARIVYGAALIGLILFVALCVIARPRGPEQYAYVAAFMLLTLLYVGAQAYLRLSKCPRCGHRFAGKQSGVRDQMLLARKYRTCQSCRLSEVSSDLSGAT